MVDNAFATKLSEELKNAMKSGDKNRLEAIRMIKAGFQKVLIEKGKDIKPDDELSFLTAESKRRRDAIELYEKGGRQDLADKEKYELTVIQEFLPKQLDDNEIAVIVEEAIKTTGITNVKDMGKLMGSIMPKVKGKADGNRIQAIVKSKLS